MKAEDNQMLKTLEIQKIKKCVASDKKIWWKATISEDEGCVRKSFSFTHIEECLTLIEETHSKEVTRFF